MFSARYEINLCIEGFHQRLPDRAMVQAVSTRCFTSKNPDSSLGQSMWNFWRTKWPWDNSLSQYFSFPPVSIITQMLRNHHLNHLTPNDHFSGRTAPLTSRCCIFFIYSTNIRTEYFKHVAYSLFFSSSKCRLFHNATFFGSCIIHILYTGCAKI